MANKEDEIIVPTITNIIDCHKGCRNDNTFLCSICHQLNHYVYKYIKGIDNEY